MQPDGSGRARRVLMTTDTVGGVWHYAVELCAALSARGCQVTLAAMGGPAGEEAREAALAVPGLRLFESDFRLEWMDDPWDDVARAGEWLLALEAELEPEVVHINGYCHAALPFRAPVILVAHSCVLSWWRAVLGEPAPARYERYRAEVTRGLRAAAAVIAPTAAMLGCLSAYDAAPARALVIPNARDPRRFAPADKEPFVLASGRLWDQAKGLATLAEAAPGVPWPVLVAGPTARPGASPERSGSDAAPRSLTALGPLPEQELGRWMARAAIYAAPARYEPFGLGILEAGLSGCALCVSDIPSLREVWGDAALFVPPGDPGALAGALRRLAGDASLRGGLGARARERALRYRPEAMARAYQALYEGVCA